MIDEELERLWPLSYWKSQEYADVLVKLAYLEDDGIPFAPDLADISRPLRLSPRASTKVAIFGEEPYADPHCATGVAFSACKYGTPDTNGATVKRRGKLPGSLRILLRECARDFNQTGAEWTTTGCLEQWCVQGVLLWNVTPTVEIEKTPRGWKSYTHKFWPEWPPLTEEIVRTLSDQGERVFVFFGKRAAEYAKYVSVDNGVNTVLCYAHPSPLVRKALWAPKIEGSRLFTTINAALVKHGHERIDWRLI